MQTHEEIESLAPGYALSILEPEEKEAFESHLAECRLCAERVAEMRAVAGAMAISASETAPSPALKQRVLDAVRAEKTRERITHERRRNPLASLLDMFARPAVMASLMGVLMLAVVGLAFWTFRLQSSLDTSERRIARGYEAISIMSQADQWWELQGTAAVPNAAGSLAYSSQRAEACLVAMNLPPAPEGSEYYAWAVKGNQATSLGDMWSFGDNLWRLVPGNVDEFDSLIITLEEGQQPATPSGSVLAIANLGGS